MARATPVPAGRRTERGTVLPSPVVILSVLAVAFAAVAFFVTMGEEPQERVVDQAAAEASEDATTEPTRDESTTEPKQKQQKKKEKKPPPVRRGEVPVVVFNNTGIAGLAGQVSARAGEAGWSVVGADNWYGTIPATTVYHGPGMKRAANQLALDLGVERVLPAIESMSSDSLTLILTGPLN